MNFVRERGSAIVRKSDTSTESGTSRDDGTRAYTWDGRLAVAQSGRQRQRCRAVCVVRMRWAACGR
jgi:hypothetical protein